MNEFDYGRKCTKIFTEYLDQKDIIKVNRLNVEAIRRLNEVIELYRPVGRRFAIVTTLLERIDDQLKWKWLSILKSLKRQKELFAVCKKQLKNCGLTKEQYKVVMREFDLFEKRFTDIQNNIFPEYIGLTPLKDYEEELIAQGQSLDDMLNNYIGEYEDIDRLTSEQFDIIVDDILSKATNTQYLERLKEYHENMELLKQRNKRKQTAEKLEKNKKIAEDTLTGLSKIVHRNINNLGRYGRFDFDKILKHKRNGEKNVKVVIACKITGRTSSAVHYVSESETLVTSINNALILAEHDPIPMSIQEMVSTNKIVVSEVLFPA